MESQSLWSTILEIAWFLGRFAIWFLAVGLLAWGAGLVVRWLHHR